MKEEFLETALERHRVWHRKEVLKADPPWTEDEALGAVYLVNVYRELDKTTIWIRENIREPFAEYETLWLMLCIARLINLPSTLQFLLDSPEEGAWPTAEGWSQEAFVETMASLQEQGVNMYGNAYMLWGGSNKGVPKYVTTGEIIQGLWNRRREIVPRLSRTLQEAHKALLGTRGFSGFLAYEAVCDMRHTRYLEDAPDVRTWGNVGPGAIRGLNWVHGREHGAHIGQEQALEEMRELFDFTSGRWPKVLPPLEMREIEQWLCEFAKVCAWRYMGKTPKRFYNAGARR